MAGDTEDLVLSISADTRQIMRALNRLQGDTTRTTRAIERQFNTMGDRMNRTFAGIGRGMAASLAGAFSLRGAQQLIDSAKRIENALKVAGLAGDELTRVYDRLFASAQKNAAPLESLVTLYGRAAIVQKELGVSTEELLRFTDNVALSLRVAGTDAQSASGALLQLSQALGSGVVRAEEFNSILEGALPIAQAAAAGLEEAGGSVAKLRALVVDGKVSSEAFFRAFEAGAAILQEKVAGAELTVSQAFVRLQNTLVDAAGKFDEVTGASDGAVQALDRLAGIVNGLSNVFEAAANGPIGTYIARLSQLNEIIKSILPGLNAVGLLTEQNLNAVAGFIGPSAGPDIVPTTDGKGGRVVEDQIQSRIDQAFGTTGVKPVSLKNFAVPAGSKGGGGGRRGRGGGGRANEFEREIEQIQRRTAAINAETEAMARVNPLIDDYGYSVEKAAVEHELLTAAQEAGIKITPELRARISELAESYATASAEAEKLKETQDAVRDAARDFSNLAKGTLKGFISDLREGKSASEALANALERVGDKLLDIALDGLFSGGFGKGGLLGGLIIPGILHSGGVAGKDGYGHGRAVSPSVFANAPRYHSGGIAGLRPGEVPAILQRGEVVLPKGAKAGGTEVIRVDLRTDQGFIADVADQQIRTHAGTIVQVSVQQAQKAVKANMPGYIADTQSRVF